MALPRRRHAPPLGRSLLARIGDTAAAAGLEILGVLLGALVALLAMALGLAGLAYRTLSVFRAKRPS